MKSIVTLIAASSLFGALATAQPAPRYTITDLGTLPGGTFSQATGISSNGMITGLAAAADGTQHAVIWYKGRIMDLASPGGKLCEGSE
jgi:probable HAF family extracellular repeat protein